MIQLSRATADFPTRKIIRYFSCAAAEGTSPSRGRSKRGEKNARLFEARELKGATEASRETLRQSLKEDGEGSVSISRSSINERSRRELMDPVA